MKTTTVIVCLVFSVYVCRGEEGSIGKRLFGLDDAEFTSEKGAIIIPQIDDTVQFDAEIESIRYNGHYKGRVSVLVLRRSETDKSKFQIVAKQDLKVKKKKVGKNGKVEDLSIPVKAGDVIGLYAKKKNLFNYNNDRKCRGKTASYISTDATTRIGAELAFKKLRKKQNRCRSYPVIVNYKAEACGPAAVDVFFVVDISKSIKDHDLVTQREAMHYFFNHFDVSDTTGRIGVIKYKADTQVEIGLGTHNSREALLAAPLLTRGPLSEQKGGTRTDLAMLQMIDEFAKKTVSGRSQVCILLTDGKATASAQEMTDMIATLGTTEILSVAIGIGRDADFDELASIATGEDLDNVYHVSNFDQLKQISQKVVSEICEQVLPETDEPTPAPPTTLPPPVCEGEPLDVYLVVDISKSISDKELAQEQDAVRFFFNNLNVGADGARIGLIKYHHFAEEEFGLDAYTSREQLNAVDVLTRGFIKGGTRTDLAMNMMMDKYEADTATGRKQVAILLTDGKATADLVAMIARLEATSIKAIAVGIGTAADEAELKSIATGPDADNMYIAEDFETLMNIARDVVSQACT